jgi:hypothetical protein
MSHFIWPSEFEKNVTDFSNYKVTKALAIQLVAWGNVMMGLDRPDNFFEVMDAASKLTKAFTPDQCQARCDQLIEEYKNNPPTSKDNNNED